MKESKLNWEEILFIGPFAVIGTVIGFLLILLGLGVGGERVSEFAELFCLPPASTNGLPGPFLLVFGILFSLLAMLAIAGILLPETKKEGPKKEVK